MSKVVRFAMRYFWFVFTAVLLTGIGLAFAVDSDNDGMSDFYEAFFHLNPADGNDALGNQDADLLNNLEESALWTNPDVPDTDCDGFFDHEDSNALSRAVINWAHPDFTDGDVYTYTRPDWWLGAGKLGGEFSAGEFWLLAANSSGAVYFDLDRTILTNNLMLDLLHQDNAGVVATIDLLDSNGVAVATNVVGNLIAGSTLQVLRHVQLPLADYPSATRIRLNGSTGENPYQLRTSLLYIDEDADGLDADQEAQVGTLDSDPDTDHDGISDYAEVFGTFTNPSNPDSDGDGIPDGQEIAAGLDPLNADTDGDGISDGNELASGLNPLSSDTDNDGLSDGAELAAGTSARSSDSDSDGLTDGAELYGTIYQMIPGSNSWYAAKAAAERLGGHLATITSDKEQDMLFQFVGEQTFYDNHLWIGAEDLDGDGQWAWVTGEPFGYTRWAPERPKTLKRVAHYSRNYTQSGEGQLWFDNGPASGRPYLLEYTGTLDPLNPDCDGDGLFDGEEIRAGSNPLKIDTDGDGLSDFDEIRIHGTSPANTDSDFDGLSDPEELAGPTDPLNPDCDGDGLPDGAEVYGTLYQMIPGDFTWFEAKADAERLGGHLATITGDKEQDILFQCVGYQAFYDNSPWFGAEDLNQDGQWAWITGEPFEYTRWAPDRPLMSTNRAAHYSRNYTRNGQGQLWFDNGQIEGRPYLLEITGLLDPFNPDMDGDGIPDGEEIRAGSNPLKADTDGDGLSDFDEIRVHGTSPAHADSDFDGLSDPAELAGPTDPLNPDCDGDGLSDGAELCGTLYYPVYETLNWHDAKADAERLGGHLATITSEAEHIMMNRFVGTNTPPHFKFWIGATDEILEGDWHWITGEPFDYQRFNEGEPNNLWDSDYLVYWGRMDLLWHDLAKPFCGPYLMEFSAVLDPLNPDTDGDGISDGEEILRGMNPSLTDSDGDGLSDTYENQNGLNGGLFDSDFDGLNDGDEIALGTDPLNPDSDGGGLLDGEEVHITLTNPANTVPDMTLCASVAGAYTVERAAPDFSVREASSDLFLSGKYKFPAVSWRITVTNAGMYRLALQLEPVGSATLDPNRYLMEVSINGNSIGSIVAATNCSGLAEGILYTPWLTPGTYDVQYRFAPFMAWWMDVCIHGLKLYSINNGTDADGNGIPDWAQARMGANVDTDGDGLSDWNELFVLGTGSLSADTDGDGMNDDDELSAGTDPVECDTDGDGVNDWIELQQALTDPLTADIGERTDVVLINGSQTESYTGSWVKEGSLIYSAGLNGSLTYLMNVPADGHYAVEFEIADRSVFPANDPVDLSLAVDGVTGRALAVQVPAGQTARALFFPPYLTAGSHSLKLIWDNLNPAQMLEVRAVRLVSYAGADADGNGQADWVDTREANSFNLLDMGFKSPVSPVCIEGSSLFLDLLAISNSFALVDSSNHWVTARRSINRGWYANAVLDPQGETEVSFAHNGNTSKQGLTVEWEETNLMNTPTNQVTIRKGDALLFNSLPEGKKQGSIIITVNGPSGTTNLISLTDQPIPCIFAEPGTYTVSGFFSMSRAVSFNSADPVNAYGFRNGHATEGVYNSGNTSTSSVFTVQVTDFCFNGNPSCLKYASRLWDCPDITEEAVVEKDGGLDVTRFPLENGGTRFLLRSSATAEQCMIARLSTNGPIAAQALINTITERYDEFYRVVEKFADGSDLIELTISLGNIPDDLRVVINIIVGGVTFLDGTVVKEFTAADFDEQGVLKILMINASGKNSDCHHIQIFQGDTQL